MAAAAQASSAERAFRQLADGCAADPTCHAAHPDVAATIDAVRQRYNATPIQVDVDLERGAGPQHWVITGDDAMAGLFNALYDASLIPALPSILDSLAAGDTTIVPALIRRGMGFATAAADGMQMSVDCADNAGLGEAADVAAIADPGRTRLIVTGALCSEWPVPATSATFNEPVVSPVPTLVLAGRVRPGSPRRPAPRPLRSRLPHATFGLWPNRGHGVTGDPSAAGRGRVPGRSRRTGRPGLPGAGARAGLHLTAGLNAAPCGGWVWWVGLVWVSRRRAWRRCRIRRPVDRRSTAARPKSMSLGGIRIVPPSSAAFAAHASVSSTENHTDQAGNSPVPRCAHRRRWCRRR